MAVQNAKQRKTKVSTAEEYRCFKCGRTLKDTEFYKSYSDAHKYIPICKECFQELFEKYTESYGSSTKALWVLCGMFDIYYYQNLVDSILDKARAQEWENVKIVKDYMRQINSHPKWKGYTFHNSESANLYNNIEDVPEGTHVEQDVKFWGNLKNNDDYKRLNELYKEWSDGTPQDTVTQVSLTKDLCKICLAIEKELSTGGNATSLLKTKNEIIKQLAIDPATLQKYKQDANDSLCLGKWVLEIEETEPAEFVEDNKMYYDVFGYEEYWKKFILRPLKNLLLGHRDYPDINISDDFINSEENDE